VYVKRKGRLLLLIAALSLAVAACQKSPVVPVNHSPIMTSLTVFPTDIGVSDSAVVTCLATDPDGDTLVYDWLTGGRLRINGGSSYSPYKYNTFNNAEKFYPDYTPARLETVWVNCTVRDRLGGAVARTIAFTVHP
jgi:hypothetical protein